MTRRDHAEAPRRHGGALAFVVLVLLAGAAIFAGTAGSEETGTSPATSAPASQPTTTGPPDTSSTSTPPPTTPPPTTSPPTTPPPTAPEPTVLRIGDRGPAVLDLQRRLASLGLWLPAADGVYGEGTEQAVLAFQKHVALGRDGVAGPATLAALDTAAPIRPREEGDHIEIDLDRQLLVVVSGDRVLAFNTSTGAPGWETPRGRFSITRQIDGMRHAPLGDLWRPKYFNGGIAIHGSPSIPGHAASHGCARLHDDAIDFLWGAGLAPIGTPVVVH